jgi:ABC-2 type transport system ATP-binding protein
MIIVENLCKHFEIRNHHKTSLGVLKNFFKRDSRILKAVDNISFGIAKGEMVGYLGPNGAGKSTTLKMLTGLLMPTSGRLEVAGFVPFKNRQAYVAKIGAVFGQRSSLWWDLPVIESLELLQHIYKIPATQFSSNLKAFKKLLDLDEFITSPARSLSLGQRMRADLCAALLHDPELLFLDEPTIGLDVVAKERIREFIRQVNLERGTTIILTTHDLNDVQKLCSRALIIDHGKLLFDGQLEALQRQFGGQRRLIIDFEETPLSLEIEGANIVAQNGSRVTFEIHKDTRVPDVIALISRNYSIRDLSVEEPEIESTIRRIYEGNLLSSR